MSTTISNRTSKETGGQSRRSTVLALGSGILAAALNWPAEGQAARKRKKQRKKTRQVCQRLAGQCRTTVEEICAGAANPEPCSALFRPGCDQLSQCDVETAVRTLVQLC